MSLLESGPFPNVGEPLGLLLAREFPRGIGKSGVPQGNPTLEELGLTKKESANAQLLATVREEKPDGHKLEHRQVQKSLHVSEDRSGLRTISDQHHDGPDLTRLQILRVVPKARQVDRDQRRDYDLPPRRPTTSHASRKDASGFVVRFV